MPSKRALDFPQDPFVEAAGRQSRLMRGEVLAQMAFGCFRKGFAARQYLVGCRASESRRARFR